MALKFSPKLREFCVVQVTVVTAVIALGLCAYVFTKLTGHGSLSGFLRLLDVSSQHSIPTYISVIDLFLASLLSFVIYSYEKTTERECSGYWLFLSVLMLYLSIDESAAIHENFGNVHNYLVRTDVIFSTLDTHRWVPFSVLFAIVVLVVLLPFLRQLPRDTLAYLLVAGCIFVTGAIGFEYLGALMLEHDIVKSKQDMAYLIRRIFEEGFEMYGIAIFNFALYREVLRREILVEIGR